MTEHASTGDAINHAIDKASDGLSQIAHAISSAAPQAWAVAVHGVYAQGLATLIVSGIAFIAGIVGFPSLLWLCFKCDWEDGPDVINIGCVLACGFFLIVFVTGILGFSDASAWARVISPDGYLAQQMLAKAL